MVELFFETTEDVKLLAELETTERVVPLADPETTERVVLLETIGVVPFEPTDVAMLLAWLEIIGVVFIEAGAMLLGGEEIIGVVFIEAGAMLPGGAPPIEAGVILLTGPPWEGAML
jgi:hypothetical protein